MVTWSRPFLPSSNRLRVKMSVYLIKMKLKGCPNTIWRDQFDYMFYPDYSSCHMAYWDMESEPQSYVIGIVEKHFIIFWRSYVLGTMKRINGLFLTPNSRYQWEFSIRYARENVFFLTDEREFADIHMFHQMQRVVALCFRENYIKA